MLVSHSVYVVQIMLDICSEEAVSLDFTFNTKKSVAIRIGSRHKNDCVSLGLCGVQLQYVQQVKYLGVMLVSARSFIHSISYVKEKCYRRFNAMYYRSRNAGSECVSVQLLKSLCIPIIILYSVEVLHLNKSILASLKECSSFLVPTITNIVNLSLISGQFHPTLKECIITIA